MITGYQIGGWLKPKKLSKTIKISKKTYLKKGKKDNFIKQGTLIKLIKEIIFNKISITNTNYIIIKLFLFIIFF